MRRVVIPELLDSDAGTPDEITASLRDLRRINQWFGGISSGAALLRRVAQETRVRNLTVLDVAGGSGYVATEVEKRLRRDGIEVTVTVVDRAATHLRADNGVAGDALALPFRDGSFDVVSSNLFVHHLEPDEVVQFAREGLRVARAAFVLNDLVRAPIHLALVYAGLPLFGRITRHDSVASVKRAYTLDEMHKMVARAAPARLEITRHYLYRMGVIAWKE
jgi:2-polyprenyl-3-methyl-5-hydroxy-6-metoxy-1,4-benzoquinol methylase